MWEELASSPYRLDTTNLRALKVELESISFFRDNEFSSRLSDGYSLPGLWIQPKLTYMPLRQIKLELGLQALIFNGTNRYPNYVYHDIALWKGDQYTRGAHLLNLTQDPEMGLQFLWDLPRIHADLWLNWQSYIFREDTHQEAFTVGTTWQFMLGNLDSRLHWYVPVQVVAQHRGGEQNVERRAVETIYNASVGAGAKWDVGRRVLKSLTAEANGLLAYQQTGNLWPFRSGAAGYATVRLGLWKFLDTGVSYFCAPKHFVSLYGNHFFSTLSVKDGIDYGCLHTAAAHVRYHHTFARGYTIGADAEAYQTWQKGVGEFSFSFGIYLRVNPSILIKRF